MSRDGGFSIGDRFTRTLYDVRLVRATRRAGLGVLVAWDAIVDASWESGERVTFEDAVDVLPHDLGDTAPLKAALIAVGLLDDAGLIRHASWTSWFGTAVERREMKRERDRRYNARRRNDADTTPVRERNDALLPTGRQAGPSVPTDRSIAREPADSPEGSSGSALTQPPGLLSIEEGQARLAAIRERLT